MSDALAGLRAMRKLLENPKDWSDDAPINSMIAETGPWSLEHALLLLPDPQYAAARAVFSAAYLETGQNPLWPVEGRTHAEALALLDRAIAAEGDTK